MNYENMSDEQISVRVGYIRNHFCFDLNNPADAWPIIEETWLTLNEITMYDYGIGLGESRATIWDARSHKYGDSKLRAAMIVYLMMQEERG